MFNHTVVLIAAFEVFFPQMAVNWESLCNVLNCLPATCNCPTLVAAVLNFLLTKINHFPVISFRKFNILVVEFWSVFSLVMLLELTIMWSSKSNFQGSSLSYILCLRITFHMFSEVIFKLIQSSVLCHHGFYPVSTEVAKVSWSCQSLSVSWSLSASLILSTILWSLLSSWLIIYFRWVLWAKSIKE